MLGAIIGDLAGSIYEYKQTKKCGPVFINNIIEENSFFSDDTILTVAIADAIINNIPYETALKNYANKYSNYLPKFSPYFKTIFSPNFTKWVASNEIGTSHGNGAMMRVSPVGFLFNTERDVIKNAKLATIPSHNSEEAISSATTIALIILYSRQGFSKLDIVSKLNLHIPTNRPIVNKFNLTCEETMPIVLYSWFNSTSFEDAIKLAISFGGDTDTNACIVGGLAEATYGINNKLKGLAYRKLPSDFQQVINNFYNILCQE